MHRQARQRLGLLTCAATLALLGCSQRPATFESPEHAAAAFVDAIERDDPQRLAKILGKDGEAIVRSGDAVADSAERGRFLDLYDEGNSLVRGDDMAYLEVGEERWALPIPIVKREQGWAFDPERGAEQIVARRIGRNELATILVSLAYVDAQYEYATRPRATAGVLEYAQRFLSSVGKRDGLYWPAASDQPASPMGPLVAAAQLEGYPDAAAQHDGRTPYHGYYYKILKAQGPNAADGAHDYVVDGRMIGGFALLAYPATYGNSGVMSFIVNHRGIVYEKDLGSATKEQARAIERFDPDASWHPIADQLVASLDLE